MTLLIVELSDITGEGFLSMQLHTLPLWFNESAMSNERRSRFDFRITEIMRESCLCT